MSRVPLNQIAKNASRKFDFNNFDEVVFINTGDVLHNEFLHNELTDKNNLPGQAKKAIKKGDILYSEIRPGNGRYLLVDRDLENHVVSTKFMVIESDTNVVLPEYLFLVLTSQEVTEYFKVIAESRSGTFPQITFDAISHYEIDLPNIEIQKSIIDKIFLLNDKIQLNTQTNQTLEQIAQAIFKSWFVDFDPVKAKIDALANGGTHADAERAAMQVISGKTNAELTQMQQINLEAYKTLEKTTALFPSEMVESELGDVPKGWGISTVGDTYHVTMGQSPNGKSYNEMGNGMLFYQGRAEFGWRFPSPRLFTTEPKRIAETNDILMSVRAPVGDINVALETCCIGRGLSALRHKSGSFSFGFYQMKSLKSILDQFNGEGTVFGSINQKDLKAIKLFIPSNELIEKFDTTVSMMDLNIKKQTKENLYLQEIRDSLLPKLFA